MENSEKIIEILEMAESAPPVPWRLQHEKPMALWCVFGLKGIPVSHTLPETNSKRS